MSITKNIPPRELSDESLEARLKLGDLPKEASLFDIARMEHPDDEAARNLFLKSLYYATLENASVRLPVRIVAHVATLGIAITSFAPTIVVSEKSATNDLEPLPFEHGLSKNYPCKRPPEPEPPPVWIRQAHMTLVDRADYRRWCEALGIPLPRWWFPEAIQKTDSFTHQASIAKAGKKTGTEQPNLAHDGFNIEEAAEFLQITPEKIGYAVIQHHLRCGVLAPGWKGWALPDLIEQAPDGLWNKHIIETKINTVTGKTTPIYRFERQHEKEEGRAIVDIMESSAGQFWYLHGETAYNLFMKGSTQKIRLVPYDSQWLHEQDALRWPNPPFIFWVHKEESESHSLAKSEAIFLREDLEEYQRPYLLQVQVNNDKASNVETISAPQNSESSNERKSLTEERVDAILETIAEKKWNPFAIPTGGKTELCNELCNKPKSLFTKSTFDQAWKAARRDERIKMAEHNKFVPQNEGN